MGQGVAKKRVFRARASKLREQRFCRFNDGKIANSPQPPRLLKLIQQTINEGPAVITARANVLAMKVISGREFRKNESSSSR